MKGLYYPQGEFWKAGRGSRPSWGWQSITRGRESILPHIMYSVGNGKNISVREDKWLKSGPIGGPATRNEPIQVAELIDQRTGKWNANKVESMFDERVVREILATPIGLPSSADTVVWTNTKSGDYSAKSGYFTVREKPTCTSTTAATSSYQTNPALWKHIWHSPTLPKIRHFLWQACQNALPTRENLYRRKIIPDPLCSICQMEVETTEHILLLCPWTSQIWKAAPRRSTMLLFCCGVFGRTGTSIFSATAP